MIFSNNTTATVINSNKKEDLARRNKKNQNTKILHEITHFAVW